MSRMRVGPTLINSHPTRLEERSEGSSWMVRRARVGRRAGPSALPRPFSVLVPPLRRRGPRASPRPGRPEAEEERGQKPSGPPPPRPYPKY